MKVLWFTNTPALAEKKLKKTLIWGGWISSLQELIETQTNIQLAVAFLDAKNAKFNIENTTYYSIKQSKFPFQYIGVLWKLLNKLYLDKFMCIIKDFNPDVIHIFGTEHPYGLICLQTNIPMVIHLQGLINPYLIRWFNGGISASSILKYGSFFSLIRGKGFFHQRRFFQKQAEREIQIMEKCKFFLGRTEWDKAYTNLMSPKSTYFYCSEVLRPDFYNVKWNKPRSDEFVFITTIAGGIYKGYDTMLRTALILSRYTDIKFKWKLVGEKDNSKSLLIYEKFLGIKHKSVNLICMGSMSAKELINEMQSSDIFIHPSHIDNSPNSVCEAMLIGMPIVATFVGGIPSILQNEVEGILVPDGDPWAMVGAIYKILCDSGNALGNKAYKKAKLRHDKKIILNELLHIYSLVSDQSKIINE